MATIWDIAEKNVQNQTREFNSQDTARNIVFCGTKNSETKLNIWELGQGLELVDLLDIPIKCNTIENLSLVIVLNLREPDTIWNAIEVILDEIKQRIKKILSRLVKEKSNRLKEQLKSKLDKRLSLLPAEEQNNHSLDISPVTLTIVGNYFDEFLLMAQKKQELLENCLRLIAHSLGASLYFVSCVMGKNEPRKVIEAIIDQPSPTSQKHAVRIVTSSCANGKPVYIPFGMDSFSDLVNLLGLDQSGEKSLMDQCKEILMRNFPKNTSESQSKARNLEEDRIFAEPLIDELRRKYEQQFEQMRIEGQSKLREEIQQAYAGDANVV
ncbi:Cytoplasmic dynein 2 light intermediate chain 1 [Cichlidogyrus casuarinus]|uniref:Cytoplasmic dynein 2 light intermediate chain 1 n=1 Tax=Cichlidogyrus casuarinus TaxID=1844966 RepID=A0ABD2PWE8_9PLAT